MIQLSLRGIAFAAFFAALVVVFGFISIPLGFTPVPITLQTLAVMLAGGLLGAGYGFLSMFLIIVLTAIGFPMLHGQGGWSVLIGPTGGYVWLWPVSAFLIGWLTRNVNVNSKWAYVSMFLTIEVFGSLLLYIPGVPWLAHTADLSFSKAMVEGCYPYLPGDAIKAAAATFIVLQIRRIFPIARLTGSSYTPTITDVQQQSHTSQS